MWWKFKILSSTHYRTLQYDFRVKLCKFLSRYPNCWRWLSFTSDNKKRAFQQDGDSRETENYKITRILWQYSRCPNVGWGYGWVLDIKLSRNLSNSKMILRQNIPYIFFAWHKICGKWVKNVTFLFASVILCDWKYF